MAFGGYEVIRVANDSANAKSLARDKPLLTG